MKHIISMGYFLILSILVTCLAGCDQSSKNPNATTARSLPIVEIAQPLEKQVTEWDEFTGRLAAVEQVDIRPRVGGMLESMYFKEGGVVAKGDLLYLIDPRPYQASLIRRKGELAQAQAKLRLATTDLNRGKELVEKKAISTELYDKRVEEFENARAEIDIARAAVKLAQLDVEYTQVRAPISGRIGRTSVTPGNLVSGGLATSTLLTTVVSMNPIHFYFTGTEKERLRYLRLDEEGRRPNSARFANEVQLKLSDETEFKHQGKMNFVDNRIDAATGTIEGRAIFDNPNDILVPGMFAKIKLKGEGPYQALLVPDEAVVTDQSQQYVFILDETNKAQRKTVVSGVMAYGLRVIRTGLSAGDRVIVNGLSRIRPGMEVNPKVVPLKAEDAENDFQNAPAKGVVAQ